jgi:hypothetical protein
MEASMLIRLALATLSVAKGRVQRIAAPSKWRVWRDDAGLHVEVTL